MEYKAAMLQTRKQAANKPAKRQSEAAAVFSEVMTAPDKGIPRNCSRTGVLVSRSAASSTDLIMLVMNERGAEKLLESKFTLGAEGSVAAGPV